MIRLRFAYFFIFIFIFSMSGIAAKANPLNSQVSGLIRKKVLTSPASLNKTLRSSGTYVVGAGGCASLMIAAIGETRMFGSPGIGGKAIKTLTNVTSGTTLNILIPGYNGGIYADGEGAGSGGTGAFNGGYGGGSGGDGVDGGDYASDPQGGGATVVRISGVDQVVAGGGGGYSGAGGNACAMSGGYAGANGDSGSISGGPGGAGAVVTVSAAVAILHPSLSMKQPPCKSPARRKNLSQRN